MILEGLTNEQRAFYRRNKWVEIARRVAGPLTLQAMKEQPLMLVTDTNHCRWEPMLSSLRLRLRRGEESCVVGVDDVGWAEAVSEARASELFQNLEAAIAAQLEKPHWR